MATKQRQRNGKVTSLKKKKKESDYLLTTSFSPTFHRHQHSYFLLWPFLSLCLTHTRSLNKSEMRSCFFDVFFFFYFSFFGNNFKLFYLVRMLLYFRCLFVLFTVNGISLFYNERTFYNIFHFHLLQIFFNKTESTINRWMLCAYRSYSFLIRQVLQIFLQVFKLSLFHLLRKRSTNKKKK